MTYKNFSTGPRFPKTDIVKPSPREDGAIEAGASGLSEGDMTTGASKGGSNSKMKNITLPPITYDANGRPNRPA